MLEKIFLIYAKRMIFHYCLFSTNFACTLDISIFISKRYLLCNSFIIKSFLLGWQKKKISLQALLSFFSPSLSFSIQIATTRQMFRRTIAYRALTHFLYYLWALPAVEIFFFLFAPL